MPTYGMSARALVDCVPAGVSWVRPTVGRYLLRELPKAALRLVVAMLLFGTITQVRWPTQVSQWVSVFAGAFFAAAVLIICGSLLYNTLYYERYWRKVDSR